MPDIARRSVATTALPPRKATAAPPSGDPAPAPPSVTITPQDLAGLAPDADAALARSFAQNGKQPLADQFTLIAATNAKTGADALAYATQRYGADANPDGAQWNEYRRSKAPYVATPGVQLKAVTVAAAKFTAFDDAVQALRANPAQLPEANSVMIRRIVDLASDRERVEYLMPLIKDLGTPEAIAYAEAATKTKPQVSWWTRLVRGLEESQF